jgi:hypothetical protein
MAESQGVGVDVIGHRTGLGKKQANSGILVTRRKSYLFFTPN